VAASPTITVSSAEVDALLVRVLQMLDRLRPGAAAALRDDPCAIIGSWPELALRFVPSADTDGRCSVAGAYVWETVPPVLAVAAAASAGRRAFTALHELAHHLQQNDIELAQALLDAGARGHTLEEAVCDAFAAAVLLPDALIEEHLTAPGPTVESVRALHAASVASRAAVCVRASHRLRSPGQVILLDYDGTVQFAAARGVSPVSRGSDQSGAAVIREALGSSGARKGRTRLVYRDGIRGEELFAQAGDLAGYLVVVTMTDRPPWETSFVLPSRETAPTGRNWLCEQPDCDFDGPVFAAPCPRCRQPVCPDCSRCTCTPRTAERRCGVCNVVYPARFFPGSADVCQECS
jgi:hypothetical protein